jgi:glycosyltransferase involved in cell wall biosynthesis
MTELRVLALVPFPPDVSPGQRYRVEQWDRFLRAENIAIHYDSFLAPTEALLLHRPGRVLTKARAMLTALRRRIRLARTASGYHLVYLFRESSHIGPAVVERILAARRIPFVFDFDDAVWVRYVSPTNAYYSLLRFPGKTASSCRLASRVIVGNSFLAEYASRYNERVTIVPSTIDTDSYRPLPVRTQDPPVIGWTGSHSTVRYLKLIVPALTRLRRRTPFRMVVVGAEGFRADGVDVEYRPWRSAREVEDLSDFDVGVMPLTDGEWERGKCAFKALQYMALGIPPVVSPVGANLAVVEDGVNGRLAATTEQWEAVLHELLTAPETRARLGEAARARVETRFSARVQAPRMAKALREVAG